MSYRYYDPAPVNFTLLGIEPAAGGSLAFFEIGTTTPKNTWSDPGLTILNTTPVQLDSSGRANTNIWLQGSYSVRLLDSSGAVIWTRDVNDGVAAGLVIPTPLPSGQFLSNDGSVLQWSSVLQPPDPTGLDGYLLTASGSSYVLTAPPVIPTPNYSFGDNFTKVGTNLDQWGTQTMPASNSQSASMSFNFPVAYATVPVIQVLIQKPGSIVTEGFTGIIKATPSTTGATVEWNTGIDDTRTGLRLVSPFEFSWRAVGKVAS